MTAPSSFKLLSSTCRTYSDFVKNRERALASTASLSAWAANPKEARVSQQSELVRGCGAGKSKSLAQIG